MTSPPELLDLAVQYHAAGNSALAEQYAAAIVAEDANHAEALHLLGLIAQQKGRLHDAMAYLRRSLTANGSNALTWQHAGDLLFAQGDLAGGITYYEQALRLRPDFAEGYNTLGLALMRAGKLARAVGCFQQARRLAPSFAQAINNLGVALNFQERWVDAATVFEEVLRLRPDSPEVLYNLANARFYWGHIDEAVTCYRRALSLRPANAAEVSTSLAAALRSQGNWQEAIARYQDALRLRPGHAHSLFGLSELAAQGHYDFPPQDLDAIKEALIARHGSEEEGYLYAFAVAQVLDRQGAYDEAFRYYREANDRLQRLFKKRNVAFNARAHQARMEKIISEYGPAHFEKINAWRVPTEAPVFLVGLPYSGTALVEEVLAAHPQIARVGKGGSVLSFLAQGSSETKTDLTTALRWTDAQTTQAAAAGYLRHLSEDSRHADRVLGSSLDNVLGLGVIATLFSGARAISCRRDRVDIALACYFQNRSDLPFSCSLDDIAAYARAYEKLMAHWRQALPLTIHEVDFEALLQDREKTARALVAFCGLDWDERCARESPSSDDASGGRWQHYRGHLGPVLKALED
jgi:tetratricopeptide (TPR) repeat protein